jgi:hypothetical protein
MAGATATFSAVPTVSANKNNDGQVGEVSGSITLDPEHSMGEKELSKYANNILRKNDREDALRQIPPGFLSDSSTSSSDGVTGQATSPSNPQNITLDNTWDSGIRDIIATETGQKLGESRHLVSVYQGDYQSEDGENVYILWHLSRTDFGPDETELNTKVEKMENFINLPNDWSLFTYEPQDTISSGSGQELNVGISAAKGVGGMSLSTSVTVGGGTILTTNETTTGDGAKYQLEFTGCSKGDNDTEIMNGLSLLTTNDSSISKGKLEWSWSARLNSTVNCIY